MDKTAVVWTDGTIKEISRGRVGVHFDHVCGIGQLPAYTQHVRASASADVLHTY